MALHWYLVRTKRAAEPIAQANLERQGYSVYYPRLKRVRRARGCWKERVEALFPSYLFVRVDVGQQTMAPVRSTLGVMNMVRFGAEYNPVPDAIVDDLMKREEPGSGLHRLEQESPFQKGERVRIEAGPFNGLEGIFQRAAGKDRVVILLQLLGAETTVKVPAGILIPQRFY